MNFPAEDEPDNDILAPHHFYTGIIIAAFGFLFAWPTYPGTGAAMTLIGLLIAIDDAISHAFGVWTPLDWLWNEFIREKIP